MIVRFTPRAESEFIDALVLHESKWKKKGRNLYREFDEVFENIGARPDRYPIFDSRNRKAVLAKCPYCVIYRVRPDVIWIIAIAHHKRKEGFWKRRSIPKDF